MDPGIRRSLPFGVKDSSGAIETDANENLILHELAPRDYSDTLLGGDQLLVDANGESRISVQDYAVAMIDELELPAHIRKRFTVGY